MKKSYCISIVLLLITSIQVFAQNDYLVTKTQDTIYGKVRDNFRWFGNKIWVTNETGKQVFKYRDISAYSREGKRYEIIYYPTKRGRMLTYHCQVFSDGKLKFLVETNTDYDEQFLVYQGKTYRLETKYFPQDLWDQLIQCEAFKQKHGAYHKTSGGRWIWVTKQLNIWYNMVNDYNQFCSN